MTTFAKVTRGKGVFFGVRHTSHPKGEELQHSASMGFPLFMLTPFDVELLNLVW